MIPLTLLCLALFALAWGYRKASKRAKEDKIVAAAMADDWAARGLSRFDRMTLEDCTFTDCWVMECTFTLPMSCPTRSAYSVACEGPAKSLSLDDLMRSGKADG